MENSKKDSRIEADCRNSADASGDILSPENNSKSIVLKNKSLAKSGEGVLSMTEEEKIRVELLTSESDFPTELSLSFIGDDEFKEQLMNINSKLQVFSLRQKEMENIYYTYPEICVRLKKINKKLRIMEKFDGGSLTS